MPASYGEAARKDVERAFGVLQARWVIVKGPVRFWYKEVIAHVMYLSIILDNMIVEDEGAGVTNWGDGEVGLSSCTMTLHHVRWLPMCYNEVLAAQASMRNQQDHARLRSDMVEEIWALMYPCIILDNMIIEDEGTGVTDWGDEEVGPSSCAATPHHVR
ncbi:uncharacterized protein LOC125194544 [Salvia hispanica]|uniref:uncharacterized protein LOC125194544 n=1 Tax=Salvia hispanica TaxID=49212 RepID=UPI002009385C|nr:uncharacterized protein LOC125194544 [Salvia hispanica]